MKHFKIFVTILCIFIIHAPKRVVPQGPETGGGAPGNEDPANQAPDNGNMDNGAPGNGAPANGAPANGNMGNGESANGPPANGAPANGDAANGAPANGSPANEAPVNGAPANGAPANGNMDNGNAANGPPANGMPGNEAPANGEPVTEAPTNGTPATEAPATEAPATEAPATEAPATEAPATEAPATEAPATEAPSNGAPGSGATTEEEPKVKEEVVDYLNNRINIVLRENPEKNPADLKLAALFNEQRTNLANAIIRKPAREGDDLNAEEALEMFRNFMQQYNTIADQLKNATDDLMAKGKDPNLPTDVRYEALILLLELRNSESIQEAEKALMQYENFEQNIDNNMTNTPTASAKPPLTDEYKHYLEEILNILQKHYSMKDGSKIQDLLQEILNHPEQLKKLAAALRELCDEDNEEDDWDWDLFSLF